MSTESIWETYKDHTNFPTLDRHIDVDVAIIGGGITGITTAQCLSERGCKVAVIESLKVGVSNTGHSTGNLYETMGKDLQEVRKKFSSSVVEKVLRSRRDAITFIENNVNRFGIDCDFIRVPWYYYSAVAEADHKIEKEHKLASEVGIPLEFAEIDHPSLQSRKAVKLEAQAQFNPLRYVQGLAKNIDALIFENSPVLVVHEEQGHCVVKTERGSVNATYVVHATHTPKGIMPYHMVLGPYREYGICCKIRNPQHPPGIYFGYYNATETISTRLYERDGEHYLVVVGDAHKVGQGDSNHNMRMLENFAAKYFEVVEFTHRWGGQHYKPADYLPYIGRKGHNSRTLVATGFSTHGLVFGTVAARIIADEITGKKNEFAEIYSAVRFTPLKSAPKFIKENVNVMMELVKDYLKKDETAFADVAPGEGKVLLHEGHKLAVYKSESEELQVCSAVCPHMGCIVHFNTDEKSWDCPCHGSRFATNGEVLEGPALEALASAALVDNEMPLRTPLKTLKDELQTGLDF